MIVLIFPKGADGRLRKIMAESAELTIEKALERLSVSREKEKIILKREQETEAACWTRRHGNLAHGVRQKPNIHRFCHCEGAIAIRKEVCDCGFPFKKHNWRTNCRNGVFRLHSAGIVGRKFDDRSAWPATILILYCRKCPPNTISWSGELKNSNAAIHKAVSAIVVDESHTAESWTGKRWEEKASCVVVILHALEILKKFCLRGHCTFTVVLVTRVPSKHLHLLRPCVP